MVAADNESAGGLQRCLLSKVVGLTVALNEVVINEQKVKSPTAPPGQSLVHAAGLSGALKPQAKYTSFAKICP
jgi:hypothetical protein